MLSMNLKMHSYISETAGFMFAVYLQMHVCLCAKVPWAFNNAGECPILCCIWDPWLHQSAAIPADIRSITLIC